VNGLSRRETEAFLAIGPRQNTWREGKVGVEKNQDVEAGRLCGEGPGGKKKVKGGKTK